MVNDEHVSDVYYVFFNSMVTGVLAFIKCGIIMIMKITLSKEWEKYTN